MQSFSRFNRMSEPVAALLTTAAVDRALSHDGTDFRALILKADLMGDSGDPQAALSFYLAAIKAAAMDGLKQAAAINDLVLYLSVIDTLSTAADWAGA